MSSDSFGVAAPAADPAGAAAAAAAELRVMTDPRAMRALAHPLRIALLELLAHAGTLTATQASELVGESPANCAFHLRTLAKYGFIEEADGGRGRERPWRRVHAGINIPEEQASPDAARAADELSAFLTTMLLDRARTILAQRKSWPAEWQAALGQSEYVCYLTPEEAREVEADLHRVLSRHSGRVDHPERRPAGAMPVEILAIGYPLLHLSAAGTASPGGGAPAGPEPTSEG